MSEFKWTNRFGDIVENTSLEDFDDYDYEIFMAELGLEDDE